MKHKVIYKITNKINQKVYIGQSVDVAKRWSQHKTEAKKEKPSMIINQAMRKYGIENFTFEVVCSVIPVADEKEYCKLADEAEDYFISFYNSMISNGKGYNVSRGGPTSPKTEAWKETMRNYWKDPDWSGPLLEIMRKSGNMFQPGYKPSPKAIEATIARLKRDGSPMKGHRHSKESNEKNRIAHLGRSPANKIQFTEQQIIEIKSSNKSSRQLAKDYNVSKTTILQVRRQCLEL